ncbi:MAG: flavin reductase family protein [Alphaproteobacteria bacterium]|nr:flavin reductase family protein [Alphaproteobacteria bacterium]
MSQDSRAFRDALGHFATGVAVVTAAGPGGALGLTVNSFASVSLQPPLILWSLDKVSDRFGALMAASHFAVNTLGGEARALAQSLARKGHAGLGNEAVRMSARGVPLLGRAIAHFECSVEHRYEGGDHVIFVGRVLAFDHTSHSDPLIYYRGRYRALSELEG